MTTTFDALSSEQLAAQSEYWAQFLARELWLASRPERLTDFAFHLPVYVLASLLGVPQDRLPEVAAWVGDFVRGIAAGSSAQHIDQCKQAAEKLLRLFHALLVDQQTRSANTLLIALTQNAHDAGCEDNSVIAANAIGFLMQSYEATAGLIGNTLVLLAKNQEVCAQITGNWTLVSPLLCEVLRCDSSVQNTRRFVARDGTIAGCDMKAGDAILVVLAAANYDPTANPKPEVFDLLRETRQIFIFGVGIHACSGETIATSIAEAAIKALLAIDLEFAILRDAFTYRSSANTRIPVWTF